MMKRAILAAALLLAPLAADARVLVVKPPYANSYVSTLPVTNSVASGGYNNLERILEQFRTLGVEFDVARGEGMKTEWARLGQYNGRTYDAVVHLGWYANFNSTLSGYYPDSLTLQDAWPRVPQVFIGWPGFNNTQNMADIGSGAQRCSTGIADNPAHSGTYWEHTEWLVGTTIRWKGYEARQYHRRNTSAPAGTWRPLVGIAKSTGWSFYLSAAHLRTNPADFDSATTFQSITTPDTVAVWERYTLPGGTDRGGQSRASSVPVIFCSYGSTVHTTSSMRIAMALARADSASGGQVFTAKNKFPVKFAFQTTRWGGFNKIGYRSFSSDGTANDWGVQCVSDSCDTSFVKATLDSLRLLNVPMSFGVQTDSMSAYATQMEWLRTRYPQSKVYPYNVVGTASTGNPASLANTASNSYDTFGATRLRTLLPSGATGTDPSAWTSACATDTGSVFCLLTRAYAKLRNYFGEGRLDRVMSAPLEDWTPTYMTRGTGSVDSLVWVLWLAGVRGMRVSPYGAVSLNSFGGAGTGAPRGGLTSLVVWPVRAPGSTTRLGDFVFIPSREFESTPARLNQVAHDLGQEFARGVMEGDWYSAARGPLYTNGHEFMSRPLILELSAASLGGHGAANPARMGWWYAKWLTNQCRAVNRLAGRTIITPASGSEVADYVLRSGVR